MDPSVLAAQAVGGFTVGALVGYAIRKVTKWILIGIAVSYTHLTLPTN